MPEPRFRSRTFKRIKKTLPSGERTIQYRKPNTQHAKCSECGKVLKGVARGSNRTMHNMPKSMKTVARPFGGNLCSACARSAIKAETRKK
jgi:large subunit ribosomal protein L34e